MTSSDTTIHDSIHDPNGQIPKDGPKLDRVPRREVRVLIIGTGFTMIISAVCLIALASEYLLQVHGWLRTATPEDLNRYINVALRIQICVGIVLVMFGTAYTMWLARASRIHKRVPNKQVNPSGG